MFTISSAETCCTGTTSMANASFSVRLDFAALERGMMARVFASATGRIWYTSPTFTAAMPLLRRIWFRSGQRSSRAILPAVRMVTWPSMRGSIV